MQRTASLFALAVLTVLFLASPALAQGSSPEASTSSPAMTVDHPETEPPLDLESLLQPEPRPVAACSGQVVKTFHGSGPNCFENCTTFCTQQGGTLLSSRNLRACLCECCIPN